MDSRRSVEPATTLRVPLPVKPTRLTGREAELPPMRGDGSRIAGLELIPQVCGALVFAIGFAVLCGWWLGIGRLTTLLPGVVAMQPNAAASLLVVGAATLLLSRETVSDARRRLALALALCVGGIGFATSAEHLLGESFGIDKLLSGAPSTGSGSAGRMAPTTAFCLAALGGVLTFIDARTRVLRVAVDGGLLAAGVVALATLIAYLFSSVSGDGFFRQYTQMAFLTAVAIFLAVIGILHTRPHRDLMARVTANSLGGAALRRIMPAAILAPAAAGWLTLAGERFELYNLELGMAVFTVAMVCCFSTLLWLIAGTVDSADLHRRRADEMRRLVRYDELSGLFNRRHLNEILEEECKRAIRYERAISIMMVDIDGFGQVNKRLGHPVGDWMIRQVAREMMDVARDSDVAGRYGGDEFILVLPETDAAGAAILAERLRGMVEACQLGARRLPGPVTISVGVFTPTETTEYTPETLISRADVALRQAKRRGKNQVVVDHGSAIPGQIPVVAGHRTA